jgi:tetratricopeptide (TPR) repeat protein
VSSDENPTSILYELYQQYLIDQDTAALIKGVSQRYMPVTLERLAERGDRVTRRAAVLSLGFLANYDSNAVLGRALHDQDRGVRTLAENSVQAVWKRAGTPAQCEQLAVIVRLNNSQQYEKAVELADKLLEQAPWFAEIWNQRAVAYFNLAKYKLSIRDCHQTLEINPYHFGAATGMGQCYLQTGKRDAALESLRRALRLNPALEGVRAHVVQLERAEKDAQE